MNKIHTLEQALSTNKEAVNKLQDKSSKEARLLLLQRGVLKDRLLQAYREQYIIELKQKESV